jgi:hypothetical protein
MFHNRLFRALGRATAATLTLVVALLVTLSSSAAAATVATTSNSTPALAFSRSTYKFTTAFSSSTEANLYQAMGLQATDSRMVPVLKAANPNLKLFLYQDVLLSRPSDNLGLTTCTDYPSDTAHPNWFLTDASGNRLTAPAYPGNYVMDVANPAYQQACLAHATALAKKYGFDGIFLDDVNAQLGWTIGSNASSPLYPTPAAWQSAVSSMVSYVGPGLHAQQLLSMANIGGSAMYPGLWQKWNGPLDGAMEESFTDGGSGLGGEIWAWSRKLANAAWSEANGKYTMLHSWNTTETGNTYGLASMLLVGGGHLMYSTSNHDYTSYEMWYPEYTTAQQLGAPTGPYTRLANGVYQRQFAGGLVVVNPTNKSVGSFSLGGGIYSGSSLTRVTSVSLGRTAGLILQRVG